MKKVLVGGAGKVGRLAPLAEARHGAPSPCVGSMERLGLSLWLERKWPEEPDDAMQPAISGQLTEVNALQKHRPIRKQHAPAEAKLVVMHIDLAGDFKASSRELLKDPANMINKLPLCG